MRLIGVRQRELLLYEQAESLLISGLAICICSSRCTKLTFLASMLKNQNRLKFKNSCLAFVVTAKSLLDWLASNISQKRVLIGQ